MVYGTHAHTFSLLLTLTLTLSKTNTHTLTSTAFHNTVPNRFSGTWIQHNNLTVMLFTTKNIYQRFRRPLVRQRAFQRAKRQTTTNKKYKEGKLLLWSPEAKRQLLFTVRRDTMCMTHSLIWFQENCYKSTGRPWSEHISLLSGPCNADYKALKRMSFFYPLSENKILLDQQYAQLYETVLHNIWTYIW